MYDGATVFNVQAVELGRQSHSMAFVNDVYGRDDMRSGLLGSQSGTSGNDDEGGCNGEEESDS